MPSEATSAVRRFACTSCGKCCDRGPEMALSEAAALAGVFITSMLFRVYSLPLAKSSKGAARWSEAQGSTLPVGAALDEERAWLSHFSVRDTIDRARGRSLHLTISALTVDREKGRCPALSDNLCGIYETRPLTCRTVPMHYSRPPSVLASYLDRFASKPGYACNTSADAPMVFDGRGVTDASALRTRHEALDLAASERGWKTAIVSLMDDPGVALAAGVPTHNAVIRNSDAGSATAVSMLVALRVARNAGLLAPGEFDEACRKQVALLKSELARGAGLDATASMAVMLSDYEAELGRPSLPSLPGA